MNEEGEKAIKEILELLNSGWDRTGEGTYTKYMLPFPLARADAIEVERRSREPLEICEWCLNDTSNPTV